MLKKLASWFIIFGLSFLVSDVFGWTEQGKAFLYIYLGTSLLLILSFVVVLVITGFIAGCSAMTNGISFLVVLETAIGVAIVLFVTWGISKLFGIDFYVTYQIISFAQCLFTNSHTTDD